MALKPEGNKPIEQSDAAAIQAAEARATGRSEVVPGGVGAEAQCAASINAQTDDKTTLRDVLKVSSFCMLCGHHYILSITSLFHIQIRVNYCLLVI